MFKSIPNWRSRHLEELGLHFRMKKEIVFPVRNGFVPPSFEKIVLVDDRQAHLESVSKELNRRGISFLGFLYIPKILDPIDEKVAKLHYTQRISKLGFRLMRKLSRLKDRKRPNIRNMRSFPIL